VKGLPPRYEAQSRLGQGGGGEVWAVRDCVLGTRCALKVLAKDAGQMELVALVREAVALSGLEGLGVPRVLAFGALDDGRRYMVRELVEGRSLDEIFDQDAVDWLEPLADAADQLTALHRAGLLHGDVKPANVVVSADRRGTLVDLGLAAPLREGGTLARGLTPKYAAPELLAGEPLTVRAEVYALAATLAEGLARRGSGLSDSARVALGKVAARGKDEDPHKRYPSSGELASALRVAAGLEAEREERGEAAWPVVGIDGVAEKLSAAVRGLASGEALALVGERGSGRSTLARRVAWTLGVAGQNVVIADAPTTDLSPRQALALAMGDAPASKTVIAVDDADALDDGARELLREASRAGARLVVVGTAETARACAKKVETFEVPPLDAAAADELLRRAMPSLPRALAKHLAERTGRRPGALRAAVRALAGRAVVSAGDVDSYLEVLDEKPVAHATAEDALASAERLVDLGRVSDAEAQIASVDFTGSSREIRLRAAIAEARIRAMHGEPALAVEVLERTRVKDDEPLARAWNVAMSRALLRLGRFAEAAEAARMAVLKEDALAVEAVATLGVAQAYLGDDKAAQASVERSLAIARAIGDGRGEAFALGSLGIVHHRGGRRAEARDAQEKALAAAEKARDASTVAAARLNLAGIAREEGDIARALEHYEAMVDLGKRAGGLMAVQQARVNLINLDLYLGRHARARAAIELLQTNFDALPTTLRAQLLGCRAELAARTGDVEGAARLYETCALAYENQGRAPDAAEARLEALFMRASQGAPPALADLDAIESAPGADAHRALALLVRGLAEAKLGHDDAARSALDEAVERAKSDGQQERVVWALSARARVLGAQGLRVQARRDVEAALAMLEETASRLPRDLREVFWDEPRRAALRRATNVTVESVRDPRHVKLDAQTLSAVSIARPAEDKLARVLEIVREIATEHDLPRLLGKVTDHAIALLGGERGFVVLANEEGKLEAHASRDRAGDDPHAQFSRSVAEKVVETGEPVVALRAREDARLAEAVSVHQLAIQSIACVPVRGAPPLGRPIGALYVETRARPGSRFEQELPLLAAFADQAAIAIESARLTTELAEKNAELEAAHKKLEGTLERRSEQLAEARRDLSRARAAVKGHFGYAGLVGTSAAMRRVYALIDRLKDTDVPALVTGESGTGKEIVARAIHGAGPRAKKTFMGVNCGAIPANLLESELFGHVRGAFTGADRDRKGLLRECEGGTLLLDEIGEMPLKMQAGLLRVLQDKMVRPVGGTNEEPVDVRIVAATNRELEQMVKEGSFREDLYYRLHVVELRVPALRERTEDIPPLIDHFLTLFQTRYRRERKTISRDAVRRLCAYEWPGNVRQLEHVLLNAWLMSEEDELSAEDIQLPDSSRPSSSRTSPRPARNEAEFKDSEKERILRALAACNWNRVKAAELTGIPRRTFYRRLKEFGIL
jgi:transcriptional regulator with GAF, ATPase, and Fis domain/energy-coupling factor transporter ATP-binding protein EcfA2